MKRRFLHFESQSGQKISFRNEPFLTTLAVEILFLEFLNSVAICRFQSCNKFKFRININIKMECKENKLLNTNLRAIQVEAL